MGGWRGIPPPPCRSCPVLTLMEVSCDALFSSVLTLMGVPCDTLFSSVLTLMGVPCDESPRHRFAAALPPLTRGARGRIIPRTAPVPLHPFNRGARGRIISRTAPVPLPPLLKGGGPRRRRGGGIPAEHIISDAIPSPRSGPGGNRRNSRDNRQSLQGFQNISWRSVSFSTR